jgi:Protein of unknown function with PCYCGC motif
MAGSKLPWAIAGAAAVAAVAVLLLARPSGEGHHPDPRPGITGAKVLPASLFGEDARLVQAYTAARTMPEVFDGLYCYCHCKEDMGHRSLLTCFESEHAASCDICLAEAAMAAEMHEHGASLDAIRRAIDTRFKT